MAEEEKVKFVADAPFFIKGSQGLRVPWTIYTTRDVLNEVRDERARARMDFLRLGHEIVERVPTEDSIRRVRELAAKTGDLAMLSSTDVGITALALDLLGSGMSAKMVGVDFDVWITPDNFGQIPEGAGCVLCTADTVMQAIAMQLGIAVVDPLGAPVAEVKRWLLRCWGCGEESRDTSREFCPGCGRHGMVRYALVMRDGVEEELPLPERFVPTARSERRDVRPGMIMNEAALNEAMRKWRWSGGSRTARGSEGLLGPRKRPRPAPTYGSMPEGKGRRKKR